MHQYGTTREQIAQIALNARRNAADNPKAIYRQPLTMTDYLSARVIASPLCLFDCDVPADGATALVVSHIDTVPDAPRLPVHVNAVGTALRHRNSWVHWPDPTLTACHDAGERLWERTELRPSDVDVAELYDGFTILAMLWPLCRGRFADRPRRPAAPQYPRWPAVGGPATRLRILA
jgi:acetyl-CoA acetyltransferase